MTIKIKLNGDTISGNARVLNNLSIIDTENIDILLEQNQISGNAVVMENLDISQKKALQVELSELLAKFDQAQKEYGVILQILNEMQKKSSWKDVIKKFGSDLTTGTIASMLSTGALQIIKAIV